MKDKDEVLRQKLLRLKYDLIELTKQEDADTVAGVLNAFFRVSDQLAEVQMQLMEALNERDHYRTDAQLLHASVKPLEVELSELRTALHLANQSNKHLRKELDTVQWENRRLRGSTKNFKRKAPTL